MRLAIVSAILMILAGSGSPQAGVLRAVVADVPYALVWDAARRAVADYPVERAADGVIVTGRLERAGMPGEAFARVAERVTLHVEAFADRVTRVTVEVDVEGWRGGVWVPIADTEAASRRILARLRVGED